MCAFLQRGVIGGQRGKAIQLFHLSEFELAVTPCQPPANEQIIEKTVEKLGSILLHLLCRWDATFCSNK